MNLSIKVIIGVFLLISVHIKAQSFEGKISYNNYYQSKLANLKSEQLNAMMGTKQDFYIKGSSYKSVFNGAFTRMQIYKTSENKSYTLTGKNDTLYFEDYGINKDEAVKSELLKNQDTVMGIPCDVLIVETKKSKTYFYFNYQYSVNPELFKQHTYGNWYYTISKTMALPLKTVYQTEQFILTSTVIEIKEQKLEDAFFEIVDKKKVAIAFW
jgi:hypothetical protein